MKRSVTSFRKQFNHTLTLINFTFYVNRLQMLKKITCTLHGKWLAFSFMHANWIRLEEFIINKLDLFY